ncbi:hypothetical protein [Streptomyces sp. NPDC058695]|uniref:hypothetical protein n=1 Tax=Streptomyces sp. NPDC058695 TaxID=3346604 RepID=UPI00365CC583
MDVEIREVAGAQGAMGSTPLPTPYAVPKVAATAAAKAVIFSPVFMAAPGVRTVSVSGGC